MSSIKLLNDITVFNSITAISGLQVNDLVVLGGIHSPIIADIQVTSGYWNVAYNYVVTTSANETEQQTNSANWNNAFLYSTVYSQNSAKYENVYSTVNSNSSNWNTAYTYSLVYASNSANPNVSTIVISNSASTPVLAIGTTAIPDSSKLYVIGNVNIVGNLSASGTMTFTNTNFTTTSALCVVNNGTGPTIVGIQYGDQPIMALYDAENVNSPALWVDGSLVRPGFVGIGTNTPNTLLTVKGAISSNTVVFSPSANFTNIYSNTITSVSTISTLGTIFASSLSAPHSHVAANVTDFYSAALSATLEQTVIYSLLFG